MTGTVHVAALEGAALAAALDGLAQLRITVFADYPYLYDGDLDYERRYLAGYAETPGAVLVGAFDGDMLVGAATAMPMEAADDGFAAALSGLGITAETVLYFGESVLLPGYRGQGLGHRFFDIREAHAASLGRAHAGFCAVSRPRDHPARPAGYRPLDGFWRKRGYAPVAGAVAHFSWRDLGTQAETEKPLQLWMRAQPASNA